MHTAKRLLEQGEQVVGLDNLNDNYDSALQQHRLAQLTPYANFRFVKMDLADRDSVIASLMERIAKLKNSLEDVREGEVSQVAVKSLEPTGVGRKLVLMLGIVLGGLLAVMGVFFMQFAGLVYSSFNE